MAVHKIALVGLLLAFAAPVFAAEPGMPGVVNYVEGQAALEGRPLSAQNVGEAAMRPGEVLTTGQGRVEVLLTPGVFLRMDDNSAVKMISPTLTMTQVELEQGRVSVEVDEIHKENDLEVVVNGATTQLVKTGFYEFNTTPGQALVFNGMAAVEVNEGKYTEVKSHRTFDLQVAGNAALLAKEKPQSFNENMAKDDFYKWNSLRSQYLAEANNQMAGQVNGGPGWYWNPYALSYTYIGVDPFWSPFGWGYYPFGWSGWYGPAYGYHRGYYGGSGMSGFHGGGFQGGGFHGGGRR